MNYLNNSPVALHDKVLCRGQHGHTRAFAGIVNNLNEDSGTVFVRLLDSSQHYNVPCASCVPLDAALDAVKSLAETQAALDASQAALTAMQAGRDAAVAKLAAIEADADTDAAQAAAAEVPPVPPPAQ